MNLQLLLPLVVTAFVTICGWIAAHAFNEHRDRINKRRELRVNHLIETYQTLMRIVATVQLTTMDKHVIIWAKFVTDMQLFGTPEQVCETTRISNEFSDTGGFNVTKLIESLRDELRSELLLKPITDPVLWVSINIREGVPEEEHEEVMRGIDPQWRDVRVDPERRPKIVKVDD